MMLLYLDSSTLVKRYIDEPHFRRGHPPDGSDPHVTALLFDALPPAIYEELNQYHGEPVQCSDGSERWRRDRVD